MKNLMLVSVFTLSLSLMLVAPVEAHHSMAGFDRKTTVTLKGTVKQFSWQNPHCFIELEVPGKDGGKAITWNVEMTAPGYLVRAGWKKTMINVGDKLTVVGNPLSSGEAGALFVSVTLTDGKTMTQQGAAPATQAK